MTENLTDLCNDISMIAARGMAKLPREKWDDWQKSAQNYRVSLFYQGRGMSVDFWMGAAHTTGPGVVDVVYCLLSDAIYCDSSFEEFCGSLGYDTDSREARARWRACLSNGKRLKVILGADYNRFLEAEH